MERLLDNIEKYSQKKQIKILKGTIEGLTSALAYNIDVIKKNTERIKVLEGT